jgi:hypothetical protein
VVLVETTDPRDVFFAGCFAGYRAALGRHSIQPGTAENAWDAYHRAQEAAGANPHRDAFRLELAERALNDYLAIPASLRRYVAPECLAYAVKAALEAEIPSPPDGGAGFEHEHRKRPGASR